MNWSKNYLPADGGFDAIVIIIESSTPQQWKAGGKPAKLNSFKLLRHPSTESKKMRHLGKLQEQTTIHMQNKLSLSLHKVRSRIRFSEHSEGKWEGHMY